MSTLVAHTELVWDTVVSFELDGGDAPAAAEAIVAWLHRVDAILSPFREDSDLSRWRRGAASLDDLAPEVSEVLGLAEAARQDTGGAFDPLFGGGRPDPTGLTKGWAVDRAALLARTHGVTHSLINAGGDVRVDGERVRRVGIEDPADPARLLDVVTGSRLSVATTSARHRGEHVVGAGGVLSATVIAADLARADALSTATYAAGGPLPRPGAEALVVFTDRSWWASRGWPGEVHGRNAA